MRYILDQRYRLRGWQRAPYGIYDSLAHDTFFLPRKVYSMVMRFDGAHELDTASLGEEEAAAFEELKKRKIVRPAGFAEFLLPEQFYKEYPARYKREAHWSITGACNLRCRHCFMSAPKARHGNPSHEQLMNIVEQLSECGIFQVGITGGEPLIRKDFLDIIRALHQREIGINVIYSNGWLIDEELLDQLEEIEGGRKIPFQLSFDGIGMHDFLRGIPGAEERTIKALKLLQAHGHRVSVSMCTHRKNLETVRETVKLMASLGVDSMKVGSMLSLGEWAQPALRDLELTNEERFSFFERYIPEYFEDDAPLKIMLSGMFGYSPGDEKWKAFFIRKHPMEIENRIPSCGAMEKLFYIGAEGMVSPCMGMADCTFASHFPNLFETPLKEILGDSDLMRWSNATVEEVHQGNDRCPDCEFKDRCAGGCRNTALMSSDNYYGVDEEACWFFKNRGEERLKAAADPAFEAYIKRHPPVHKPKEEKNSEISGQDCP